jgi:hypothetical protein
MRRGCRYGPVSGLLLERGGIQGDMEWRWGDIFGVVDGKNTDGDVILRLNSIV